jgi:dihydroorotate dehydrogenase
VAIESVHQNLRQKGYVMKIFPLAIAAGMIKEAAHIEGGLPELVQEIVFGSYTLEERPGNPEPIFYFDNKTGGSINAVGLKNKGLGYFLDHELPLIDARLEGKECRIVVSLAPLKDGDLAEMIRLILASPYRHLITRVEINGACPNHRVGQELQPVLAHDPVAVASLLGELVPDDLSYSFKIAPDTEEGTLEKIVQLCSDYDIARIVSGNTRRGSAEIDGIQQLSVSHGGWAGAVLLESALEQVKKLRRMVEELPYRKPTITGCGGILLPEAMKQYQDAGADDAQVATLYWISQTKGIEGLITGYYAHYAR